MTLVRLGCVVSWIIGIILSPIFIPILIITILISKYKKDNIKPKIVWGPVPIINIKYNSQSVRDKGYDSDTIVYTYYGINNKKDYDYVLRIFKNIKLHYISIYIISYPVFLFVLLKYDIFQFYFNGGFLYHTPLRWLELPILKISGKKIVVSPYGGDVIQVSKIKKEYKWNISDLYREEYSHINERDVFKQVAYFTPYADVVIGVGELVEYIPWYDVIIPMNSTLDIVSWTPPENKPRNEKVIIVHAPNHRSLKGTQYLIQVCDDLKKKGHNLDLVLVENMKNNDARIIYESADIIADQFVIGWFALFAAEGMALGKPVLCYLRDDFIEANSTIMHSCPIVNTNPDTLEENLKLLIVDKPKRIQLGDQGRKYVETYGISYVGTQLDKIYTKLWSDK